MNKCILISLLVFVGCGYRSDWERGVPGSYQASDGRVAEGLIIDPNGFFRHEVSSNGVIILAEQGRWRLLPRRYEVSLSDFTHSIEYGSISTNGLLPIVDKRFLNHDVLFWPVFQGGCEYSELTPRVERDYVLKRVSAVSSNTVNGLGEDLTAKPR